MRLRPPQQLGRLGQRTLSPRRLSSGPAAALPASVDAVVIGGGCVGASACYHLQEQGLSTLLLEAHSLTAGTTWHTAGMLWRLRPSYVDIELHTHTRELAMRLEEAPGAAWTQNGGLFIAGNKERLAEYERLGQTGEYYGIASEVLSPSEVPRVHPLLRTDDVYGALYSPTDGAQPGQVARERESVSSTRTRRFSRHARPSRASQRVHQGRAEAWRHSARGRASGGSNDRGAPLPSLWLALLLPAAAALPADRPPAVASPRSTRAPQGRSAGGWSACTPPAARPSGRATW